MTISVEEHYQYFGPEVVREIRSQLAVHGSLLPLLTKLHLQTPHDLHNQHVVLKDFIFRYGIAFFMKSVQSGMTEDEIERRKVDRLVHDIGRDPRFKSPRRRKSDLGLESPFKTPPPGTPSRRNADKKRLARPGTTGRADNSSPADNKSTPATPPASAVTPATPDETAAPGKWIETPTYKGPDRRSGVDRRKRPSDRRASLQVVFKNRRFGGRDRRKTLRREEDRKKAGAK